MNKDEGVPPLGARGCAYIARANECGLSDQTDLNRTVFLDPLGRWSIIREAEPDWFLYFGGAQGGRAGALSSSPLGFPFVSVASRVF